MSALAPEAAGEEILCDFVSLVGASMGKWCLKLGIPEWLQIRWKCIRSGGTMQRTIVLLALLLLNPGILLPVSCNLESESSSVESETEDVGDSKNRKSGQSSMRDAVDRQNWHQTE